MSLFLDSLLDLIAYTDPASGKSADQLRKVRARQAVVVVGQDAIGRVFVLHAWAARCPTAAYIEHLFQVNQTWRPQRFGVEANAMQVVFGDTVQLLAQVQGHVIPFEPVYQPTNVKKEWRNRTRLQPVTANGRLFLQPTHHELKAELLGHPNYPTNDLVDALATAVDMLPTRQRQVQVDEGDIQYLATYLRETGAPPAYIQQRVAAARQERLEQTVDRVICLPLASR